MAVAASPMARTARAPLRAARKCCSARDTQSVSVSCANCVFTRAVRVGFRAGVLRRRLARPAASRFASTAADDAGGAEGASDANGVYAELTALSATFSSDHSGVLHVELARPDQLNAMNKAFWIECAELFEAAATDKRVRAIVVSGQGRLFTAGLDLMDHQDLVSGPGADPSRRALELLPFIRKYQAAFSAIEACLKPTIAAVHGACIGGGVDLISSSDIRYCTSDAFFSIKEVDVGLAADVGTLQRMPKLLGGDSLMRELAFTGRNMSADEAAACGFVGRVFADRKALMDAAFGVAAEIASKSPVAVQGTKYHLNYARDHPSAHALEHQAVWNSVMLQTPDMPTAAMAMMSKQTPNFDDA